MRVSELSRVTGVAVPTIKYYLREGLLAPGARSAANQASYDEGHARRLRLVRAMIEVGGLPITTVRAVLAAVDDPDAAMHDVLGVVHHALAMRGADPGIDLDAETAEVTIFLRTLDWNIEPDAPATRELARALHTLRRLGWNVTAEVFAPYASAAERIAAWELDQIPVGGPRAQVVEGAVVGTVVFEAALVALRRLAEEHHSSRLFARTER